MQGSRVLRSSSGGFRRVSPKPKIRPGISSQDIYELTTERSFVPWQSDAKLEAHANPPLFPWQEAALANLGVQCLECSCIDPSYQAAWDERRSEPGAGRSADAVQKADEDGYGFAVELLGGCAGRRCDCRVERVQTHFSHNFSLGGGGTRTIPHVVPFYRVSVYMLPDVLEQTRRTLQRRENEGVSDRLKWG